MTKGNEDGTKESEGNNRRKDWNSHIVRHHNTTFSL